jgi:hypothetical protein
MSPPSRCEGRASVRALSILALSLAACSRTVSVYAPTPWGDDRVAVVSVVDAEDRPVTREPFVTTGRRLDVELPPEAEAIHVESFPLELESCGARFEAVGSPYPVADEAFVAPADDTIVFEPRTTPRPTAIHFATPCDVEPPVCDATSVVSEFLELPGLDLLTVARIDDTTLLYGATQRTAGRIQVGGPTERFAEDTGSAVRDSLAVSPDRLIVAAEGGAISEYDADGVLRWRVRLGVEHARLGLESNGDLRITSREGQFTIPAGSTVAITRDDLPDRTIEVVDTGGERFAHRIGTIERREGDGWVNEITDVSITADAHLVPYDGGVALIAPEIVFLRDPAGSWYPIGSPFETLIMTNGVASNGMLLIVGDSGGLGMTRLDDIAWCRLEAGLVSNFWDTTTTADGRTIYVVGSNAAGASPPAFSTIVLPEE